MAQSPGMQSLASAGGHKPCVAADQADLGSNRGSETLAERSQAECLTSLVSCPSLVNRDGTWPQDCQRIVYVKPMVGTEQMGSCCSSEYLVTRA